MKKTNTDAKTKSRKGIELQESCRRRWCKWGLCCWSRCQMLFSFITEIYIAPLQGCYS